MCSAARGLQCSQAVQVRKESRLITVLPHKASRKADCQRPKSPPSCNFRGTILAPGGCAGSACPERGRFPRSSGCPPHTRVPSRGSYHVPLGGWTGSSARSACSPAHPGTVALRASRDAGSGPRGHSFLAANSGAGDARRDALRLGFVRGGLGECTRGICRSAVAFPQPRASSIS